jgi:hypothetical protein
MAAFTTEFVSWKVFRTTLGTEQYELYTAFTAKFAGLLILTLAFRALHLTPPEKTEEKRLYVDRNGTCSIKEGL